MQICASLSISDFAIEEFDKISETVKNYFNTLEYKPEGFDFWVKDLVCDKEEERIRVFSDTHVDHDEYNPVLRELIETIAKSHPGTSLSGYYDLYNSYSGSCYYKFKLSGGQLEWEVENESEEDFMEEFEDFDELDF